MVRFALELKLGKLALLRLKAVNLTNIHDLREQRAFRLRLDVCLTLIYQVSP
jgi:hypothetical protein